MKMSFEVNGKHEVRYTDGVRIFSITPKPETWNLKPET